MKLYLRDSSVTRVSKDRDAAIGKGHVDVRVTKTTREQVECEHLRVSRVVCAVMLLLGCLACFVQSYSPLCIGLQGP